MNDMTRTQETALFAQLENDLHELEVNTFEIEDILDANQVALSGTSSTSSTSSSSSTASKA
jgi:thiazolylpeptide-type bacteriocin precursor